MSDKKELRRTVVNDKDVLVDSQDRIVYSFCLSPDQQGLVDRSKALSVGQVIKLADRQIGKNARRLGILPSPD